MNILHCLVSYQVHHIQDTTWMHWLEVPATDNTTMKDACMKAARSYHQADAEFIITNLKLLRIKVDGSIPRC